MSELKQIWKNAQTIEKNPIIKPVKLKTLLTSSELAYMKKRNWVFISVSINQSTYYAQLQDFVPDNTIINHDARHNNIIGLPLPMGG